MQALLSDEEYRQLQMELVFHPDMGDVIPGGGGLRKTCWSLGRRGKRGGVRIIYYWVVESDQILMLFMYAKNKQKNLTPKQLKILRRTIKEEYP